MIRVMMVDDHAMFREGVKRVLAETDDMRVTHEAGSVEAFRAALKPDAFDVVLLDLKLADGNGLSLIREAKALAKNIGIIVLSAMDHVRYVMHALNEGADGYVVKGEECSELKDAVRSAARGEKYICASVSPRVVECLSDASVGDGLERLSKREFRVLVLSAAGLSLKEIGHDLGINDKTVSTYRMRMMAKLKLDSTADLVRYAIEHGLID
jgi:two-component system invasion response regulator UvrY